MKFILLSILVLSFLSEANANAQSLNQDPFLNELVLVIDSDPHFSPFNFPCSVKKSDSVFCNNVKINDKNCSKTLKYKNINSKSVLITCQRDDGNYIEVAEAFGPITEDSTLDGIGFMNLRFNSNINLKKQITPNQKTQFNLFVNQE